MYANVTPGRYKNPCKTSQITWTVSISRFLLYDSSAKRHVLTPTLGWFPSYSSRRRTHTSKFFKCLKVRDFVGTLHEKQHLRKKNLGCFDLIKRFYYLYQLCTNYDYRKNGNQPVEIWNRFPEFPEAKEQMQKLVGATQVMVVFSQLGMEFTDQKLKPWSA